MLAGGGDVSGVQKLLTSVGGFCCALIAVFIIAVAAAQWGGMGYGYRPGVSNLLVLLIGGKTYVLLPPPSFLTPPNLSIIIVILLIVVSSALILVCLVTTITMSRIRSMCISSNHDH